MAGHTFVYCHIFEIYIIILLDTDIAHVTVTVDSKYGYDSILRLRLGCIHSLLLLSLIHGVKGATVMARFGWSPIRARWRSTVQHTPLFSIHHI